MKYSLNFLKKFIEIEDHKDLFSKLTNIGFNLEGFEEIGDDIIFELEITANRPDLLSHFGLAREISAYLMKEIKNEKGIEIPVINKTDLFEIKIEDIKLCPRYSALFVEDLEIKPSPDWLKNQLEKIGIRAINNIVDISNYVLASIGHPTHPFDFDTISKNTIIVRVAKKGEKIKTLDGVERTLNGQELLITDPDKPIALAGIMGGEETEVKESTKRVLIESAYFLPSSIRQTSKKMGIQTEASQRFGRGADIQSTIFALKAIGYLIEELKCGKVSKFILDIYPEKIEQPEIKFEIEELNKFFDISFDKNWIDNVLKSLGFEKKENEKKWIIIPPTYRQDVKEDVDIYEEIGRFYGYDNLPQKLPLYEVGRGWKIKEVELIKKTQDFLSSFGLTEVMCYIFSKKEEILNFESFEKKEPIEIKNPLNSEERFLRNSLIPGLLRTYRNNYLKNVYDVDIFEVGKVYFEENGTYFEKLHCGVLVSGRREYEKDSTWDFYHIKGIQEKFIKGMGGENIKFKKKNLSGFFENGSCLIEIDGKVSSLIGQAKIESVFPVWVSEVEIDIFKDTFDKINKFKPISIYPPIEIDMTIGHPVDFYYENIVKAIEERNLPNLVLISFKDRFIKQNKVFTTITLKFQNFERSLTLEEINKIREELANFLLSNYPINF